jgi:hypothetical protein
MIEFVVRSKCTSATSREVLMGLLPRILQDENFNLKKDFAGFFRDHEECSESFSKFAVQFENPRFEPR